MAIILQLRDVCKNFGDVNALQNVNFMIDRGKITSLLGPSGSGKTTLLRILAGLENPTSGTLFFETTQINSNEQNILRQKATMVFQKSLFFDSTVFSNIAYGLKLKEDLSKKEISNKVSEALSLVRLEGFEERRPKKLSGGEQQRVSMARALVLNREILLLDEPTVNLDPKNVSILEETINRVNKEKKTTIVLATHNMFQAEAISQNVALILDGTVKQTGTRQDIFGDSNKYLISFSRLENVFSGEATINEDGTSTINFGGNFNIDASFYRKGKISVHVRPEDILVSTEAFHSSARNVFSGIIRAISDRGSVVRLTVDTGRKFSVQITKQSLTEMKLSIGSKVFLTFKASVVQVI